MNPAFSVVGLTVAIGAAQGLLVALSLAALGGLQTAPAFAPAVLGVAALLLVVGLAASFGHLGRPERAWRAAAMWRTSWLSREVIALPATIAVVAAWWLALRLGAAAAWTRSFFPLAALVACALLWLCTAKIYACLRFVEEWAHPLTLVNFVAIGVSSGLVLAAALGALGGQARWTSVCGPAALLATVLAGAFRVAALRRNAGLRHRSTLQSATGIAAPHLRQISMGMSAGSFNTREFFHRASRVALRRIRIVAVAAAFVVPALLALVAVVAGTEWPWLAAVASQAVGLVADRWLFFAEARHPQNLYYQVVS